MSIEKIEAIEHVAEEEKTFEQLGYTRDFGVATAGEVKAILKENFEVQDTSRSIAEENEVIILYEDSKNPLWYKAQNGYVYAKNIRTEDK